MDRTEAKIGRSMKKRDTASVSPSWLPAPLARPARWRGALFLRRHLLTGSRLHQPLTITRSSTAMPSLITRNGPTASPGYKFFGAPCRRHRPSVDITHLLGADRNLRHQKSGVSRRAGHPDAPNIRVSDAGRI